jgi:hypothetical protein
MSRTASSAEPVSIVVPGELQGPLLDFLKAYQDVPRNVSSPQQLDDIEQRLVKASDQLFSAAMQSIAQESVTLREPSRTRLGSLVPSWLRLLCQPKAFKNQGRRTVHVRLSRGPAMSIRVVYYSRKCDRSQHREHKGCYPALECLGIFDRCSPTLASHAALTVALSGSFAEARQMLRLQGIALSVKTLTNLVYRFAARARQNLRRVNYRLPGQATVKGMRLVVALDGGRARLRQNKPGKRRKSGRHGYHTPWREPKLLCIYAIDENGKKSKTFKPIVDGTFELLEESEEIFDRLKGYLASLRVEEAQALVFIGDGAPWVSNRVPKLLKELNLAKDKVQVVVDFYHAVEHVKAAADTQKRWKETEKKAWIKKQRSRLYRGAVAKAIEDMEQLRGKKSKTETAYFVLRKEQMQYSAFKKAGWPIGSGAVESAMRRIVNLRLKGAGMFWLQANAEHVLLLRCYAKAGRWLNLLPLALRSTLLPTP